MTQIFANRAELMPLGETTEDHKQWQEEEAALVEEDRSRNGPGGGLFRGCFRKRSLGSRFFGGHMGREPIRDVEDGVDRCPRCTWELEDGLCQSCGYPSGDDELSDSDYHPDDIYDDDSITEREILNVLDHEEHYRQRFYDYTGESLEYSPPASLSDEGFLSGGGDSAVGYHGPHDRPLQRASTSSPYLDRAGTPYDSFQEATDEGSEDEDGDEDSGSLDGFVVDDTEERHHPPSSSVHSLQWETDESPGAEGERVLYSEIGSEAGPESYVDQSDVQFSTGVTDQDNPEDDSDEGPIPPSRRHIPQRVAAPIAFSSDEEEQPMVLNRRQRRAQARLNGTLPSRRNMPHHSRAAPNNIGSARAVSVQTNSDSDAPVPASQPTRRRRTQRCRLSDEDAGADGSSATATVGRLSPTTRLPQIRDHRSGERDSNESSSVIFETSRRRFTNNESRPSPNEGFSPSHETPIEVSPFPEPNHHQPDYNLNQARSPSSPPHSRRNQANRRASPLRPRHSPAPGSSRPAPAEMRDRQAQKAERKAERRRLKAERERRRSGEATASNSTSRVMTYG